MDRVWTFQEAVLAKQLYFKMNDAFCPLKFSATDFELTGPIQIPPPRDLMRDIYMFLRAEVQNLNFAINPINISYVAKELRWRQTSKRSDELLAVSALLRLDVGRILDAPNEENRMARFLTMVKILPSNILFREVPTRLSIDGFRWAGRSFLSKDPRRLFADLDTHGVICTRLGLFGAYTVFRVRDGQVTQFLSSKRFTIIDNLAENDSNWFDVWNPERQGSFPFTDIILLPRQRPECAFGTMVVAAAVLRERLPDETRQAVQRRHGNVDLICTFQKVVYLVVYRDFSSPPNTDVYDNEPQLVPGHFERINVLVR
jgi:hypothetical protein